MKNIKSLIAFATVFAFAAIAQAQFIQGPTPYKLFTNAAAILIPGETTTNFPVTMALRVPVGVNGIAFSIGVGATNAVSTTNATILVEVTEIDTKTGLTNVVDNQTYTLSVPQSGTTRYDYRTNLVNTTANLGNASEVRIRSCQNTNLASIWITNAVVYVR